MGPRSFPESSPPPRPSPSDGRGDVERAEGTKTSALALRLAIGRDGLGLELGNPATLGCLHVTELVVRLPRVRFPIDVTGGVGKFRHRRGELDRISLEIETQRAAAWASTRLHGLLGAERPVVSLQGRGLGATVTVHAPVPGEREGMGGTRAPAAAAAVRVLVFEIDAAPQGEDLAVVVHGARGANLPAAPTKLATDATAALLRGFAEREGTKFLLGRPALSLVRHLLPEAGFRAPGGDDVRWNGAGYSGGTWVLTFARGGVPVEVSSETARALEACTILRRADDLRMRGEADAARRLDVEALERAPRHPEIVRRIAEGDALATGRAEAALATLREAKGTPRTGLLAGTLELEAGQLQAAVAEFVREGEREPSNILGAVAYGRAASITSDRHQALTWLDAAVGRAPLLTELRWERARLRLLEGQLDGARADLQELEAHASGSVDRLEVVRRGGEMYRAVGLGDAAAALYERALRYAPDDPWALFGLGASLAKEGRPARGAALIARAIDLTSTLRRDDAAMTIELARILAIQLGDRPAAIARVRGVPDTSHLAIEARGLEGRWRAELGDVAGATLAFARLRTRAEGDPRAVAWLVEAASFDTSRGDPFSAHRHAEAALAAAPTNPDVLALYRRLGEEVARASGIRAPSVDGPVPVAIEASVDTANVPLDVPSIREEAPSNDAPSIDLDEASAEQRVEVLVRLVQADPTNDAAIDELVVLLSHLGRTMELFALLSARLEDAPADRRAELLPTHRRVLETLEQHARTEGRAEEAELFRMAREAVE